jgi:DNA repair exonuclease SbcCD ATPase subunit
MVADLEARKSVLIESLPTDGEIKEAEQSVKSLLSELGSQEEEYESKWQDLLNALESAVLIAKEFRAAAPDNKIRSKVDSLIQGFGLSGFTTRVSKADPRYHNLSTLDRRATAFAQAMAQYLLDVARFTHPTIDPETIHKTLESDLERESITGQLRIAKVAISLNEKVYQDRKRAVESLTQEVAELEETHAKDLAAGNMVPAVFKSRQALKIATTEFEKQKISMQSAQAKVTSLETALSSLPPKTTRKRMEEPMGPMGPITPNPDTSPVSPGTAPDTIDTVTHTVQ